MGRDFRYLVYTPSEGEVAGDPYDSAYNYDDFDEPDFWISRHNSHISGGVYSYTELLEKIQEHTKQLIELSNWRNAQKLLSEIQEYEGEDGDDKEKECFEKVDALGVKYCPYTYFCHPPEFAAYWFDDDPRIGDNEREISEAIFVYGFVLKEMKDGNLAVIRYC